MACVGIPMDVMALLQERFVFGKEICVITGTLVTTSGKNKFRLC